MKWRALATDFDGTIAHNEMVAVETQEALARFRETGALLLLVTGREMRDFKTLGFDLQLFDIVVAENGALLYFPENGETKLLGAAPPPGFVEELQRRGVAPISVGASIVATLEPHEIAVLETIRDRGLELQVIFNKGSVMILPPGVNKASGLAAALETRKISPAEVVGVGDAENDHAFLEVCGMAVAVANALPSLKQHANVVTRADHGAGVVELIDGLLAGEFDSFSKPELHP